MIFNFFRSSRVAAEEHNAGDENRNAVRTNQDLVRLMQLSLVTLAV